MGTGGSAATDLATAGPSRAGPSQNGAPQLDSDAGVLAKALPGSVGPRSSIS